MDDRLEWLGKEFASGPMKTNSAFLVPQIAAILERMTDPANQIISILRSDPLRWHLLDVVRDLGLPDCWVGAGFVRNADQPYTSATDAMRYRPETATAVAARRAGIDGCEIAAPIGLGDLFGLIVRPTPRFAEDKKTIYVNRLKSKGWLDSWPMLREG